MAFLCYFTSWIEHSALSDSIRTGSQLMMTVKSHSLSANAQSKIRRTNLCLCALAAISVLLVSCDVELRNTDAQMRLNLQAAAGRHIYHEHCDRCHSTYSTGGK